MAKKQLPGARTVFWGKTEPGVGGLMQVLRQVGIAVEKAATLEEVQALVREWQPDLVVAGLHHGRIHVLNLLEWLQRQHRAPVALVVSDGWDVSLYLEAMKHGAFDCLALPLNQGELRRIVARALESRAAACAEAVA